MTEKKPHVHKDLIVAWAHGAEIEYYISQSKIWKRIDNPAWLVDAEYRIKIKEYPVGRFAKFRNVYKDEVFYAFVPKDQYDTELTNFLYWLTDEITLIADPYLP